MRSGSGPATVNGDERCICHYSDEWNGKAQLLGRPVSQETCLNANNSAFQGKVVNGMVSFIRGPCLLLL